MNSRKNKTKQEPSVTKSNPRGPNQARPSWREGFLPWLNLGVLDGSDSFQLCPFHLLSLLRRPDQMGVESCWGNSDPGRIREARSPELVAVLPVSQPPHPHKDI